MPRVREIGGEPARRAGREAVALVRCRMSGDEAGVDYILGNCVLPGVVADALAGFIVSLLRTDEAAMRKALRNPDHLLTRWLQAWDEDGAAGDDAG